MYPGPPIRLVLRQFLVLELRGRGTTDVHVRRTNQVTAVFELFNNPSRETWEISDASSPCHFAPLLTNSDRQGRID